MSGKNKFVAESVESLIKTVTAQIKGRMQEMKE
jgi:hypothetical protein